MSKIDARNWDRPRRPTKKKMHQAARKTDFNSTPGRIRTCDRRLRRPMLYPAELRARGLAFAGFKDPHQGRAKMNCEGDDLGGQIKSGRPDSNRRLPAPKAGALPGCATPRILLKPVSLSSKLTGCGL